MPEQRLAVVGQTAEVARRVSSAPIRCPRTGGAVLVPLDEVRCW
jgi:hypothetical protein